MPLQAANLVHPLRALRSAAVDQPVEAADLTRALTGAMARGDELAFQEFHSSYFDRLYQFLLAVTQGDEHAAQDALQETLLRVARYVRAFQSEEVFWSWLKMVARSTARDGHRKHRRYLAMLDRFAMLWRSAPLDRSADENGLRTALNEALEQLPSRDRYLVEQKYVSGASTKELAAQSGLTEKAVESRLLRLRRQLRTKVLHCKTRGLST